MTARSGGGTCAVMPLLSLLTGAGFIAAVAVIASRCLTLEVESAVLLLMYYIL